MTAPYPPFADPIADQSQQVRYTYWPVSFANGDMTVIGNASLPLSGVKYSQVMRGVGELRASLQLADEEVRALNPWDKVIPRKTGIVVVRSHSDDGVTFVHVPQQGYLVWAAPRDPATGRMNILAHSIESLWARRLITKGMTWTGVDQTTIAADLLDPTKFSLQALGGSLWPGWIDVDPPTVPTGVLRTHSYAEGQETSLLEAHQARSQLATNPYEWTSGVRVLSGTDAVSAASFRPQFVMGFPTLGRELGDVFQVPRLRYDVAGSGNVKTFGFAWDGSDVPNVVWGRGTGYEDLQVKTKVVNQDTAGNFEWDYGYLQTEARFSDPDVKLTSTLMDYCYRYMWERLSGEQFLTELSLIGTLKPYFNNQVIGDEMILETNDLTWPTDWYGAGGFVEFNARIFGWSVTPPQPGGNEQVDLVIGAGRRT